MAQEKQQQVPEIHEIISFEIHDILNDFSKKFYEVENEIDRKNLVNSAIQKLQNILLKVPFNRLPYILLDLTFLFHRDAGTMLLEKLEKITKHIPKDKIEKIKKEDEFLGLIMEQYESFQEKKKKRK